MNNYDYEIESFPVRLHGSETVVCYEEDVRTLEADYAELKKLYTASQEELKKAALTIRVYEETLNARLDS